MVVIKEYTEMAGQEIFGGLFFLSVTTFSSFLPFFLPFFLLSPLFFLLLVLFHPFGNNG